MTNDVARRRLDQALAEQQRLSARYDQSIGTTGEMSAYARLQAASLAVRNCDRLCRADPQRFTFSVLSERTAPGAARDELARRLAGLMDDDAMKTTGLLASETVTNAVKHGSWRDASTVEVQGELDDERVWVEVTNAGPAFDHDPQLPPDSATDGRGLFLVDALSRAWGVGCAGGTTSVWFEVDRRQPA